MSDLSDGVNGAAGHVATTVPANLKTLVRMVMRSFYGFELYLCMETLMAYPCIKEENLADLLRLDLKQVHQHLVNLKKEKFINEKSIMETSTDGRQSKHSCFYINYKMMVNVIKYKLDKIRIQIESEEKQCTSRANFKCTNCHKTYSDLDTKDIFLTMKCLYCGHDVDEDVSCLPKSTSRNLLAKFNTQMEIVFDLLSRVEHIRLADSILRPDPIDMTAVLERLYNSSSNGGLNGMLKESKSASGLINGKSHMVKYDSLGNVKWSGDKTRHSDLFGQTRISINLDAGAPSGSNATVNSSYASGLSRQQKELPSILLLNRTQDHDVDYNDSNNRDLMLLKSVKIAAADSSYMANNQNSSSTVQATPGSSVSSKSHENVNGHNAINTNGNGNVNSVTAVSNNETSAGNNTQANGQNLEAIIMQKLLVHEKKSLLSLSQSQTTANNNSSTTGTNRNSPSSVDNFSQIGHLNGVDSNNSKQIANKKRDFQHVMSDSNLVKYHHNHTLNGIQQPNMTSQTNLLNLKNMNGGTLNEQESSLIKKRRLNNGGKKYLFNYNMYI
jgi:transcription initiation factor IIE alpha subunit